jgi:hypothetical protein
LGGWVGLASVLRFKFLPDGSVEYQAQAFESKAYEDYDHCDFLGSGTGPTHPTKTPCLQNPAVNLLPLDGQLWLTIDTRFWGRMDIDTLASSTDGVDVDGTTLNAHPACDPNGGCYVQYGCGYNPLSSEVCVSLLEAHSSGGLTTRNVSSVHLPHSKLILHSHSPALTQSKVRLTDPSGRPRPLMCQTCVPCVPCSSSPSWTPSRRVARRTPTPEASCGTCTSRPTTSSW